MSLTDTFPCDEEALCADSPFPAALSPQGASPRGTGTWESWYLPNLAGTQTLGKESAQNVTPCIELSACLLFDNICVGIF